MAYYIFRKSCKLNIYATIAFGNLRRLVYASLIVETLITMWFFSYGIGLCCAVPFDVKVLSETYRLSDIHIYVYV